MQAIIKLKEAIDKNNQLIIEQEQVLDGLVANRDKIINDFELLLNQIIRKNLPTDIDAGWNDFYLQLNDEILHINYIYYPEEERIDIQGWKEMKISKLIDVIAGARSEKPKSC